MSSAHKHIAAFIYLLNNKPELFSIEDRQNLANKITEDEDFGKISELLLAWCEEKSEINNALQQVCSTLPDNESHLPGAFIGGLFGGPIGAAGLFSGSFAEFAEAKAEFEKNLRETLINSLRQSSPPENPKPKTLS